MIFVSLTDIKCTISPIYIIQNFYDMKFFKVYLTVFLLSFFSCAKQGSTVAQSTKDDRFRAIEVVNKFHRYYNEENYPELTKLYAGDYLLDKRKKEEDNIWAERYEFGKLNKSRLLRYAIIAKGQKNVPVTYDLLLENKYSNCTLKVHFTLVKDLKGKFWLVDHRLIFS